MSLATNMDPTSLWVTKYSLDYADPMSIPRATEADVALMRDCNRPRRHRTHMARDAVHMLQPEKIGKPNLAKLPPAGVIRGTGCAPRVTAAGNGVAEIGWPFGLPFTDQMQQNRCGTMVGGHNIPPADWHSGQPLRTVPISGYGANDMVEWIKKNGLDRYVDAGEIGSQVYDKMQHIMSLSKSELRRPKKQRSESAQAALPPETNKKYTGIQPVTSRQPKKPKGIKGQAIPYCSKFYRSTMYEPEPNRNMKEMMSVV